jgi:hypothetical protein
MFCSPAMALHSCTFTIARRTPLRVKSIFDDGEEEAGRMQSPEPYKDPLDQLEFPESPSPGDYDYEPDSDDYQDDYDCEPDEDDDKVSEDGVYDHNTSATPRPNSQSVLTGTPWMQITMGSMKGPERL